MSNSLPSELEPETENISWNLDLHPKQADAFESDKKITLCCSGIQGGKSTVGSLWFNFQAARWIGQGHSLILAAPTYKILNQSTLPTFLQFASGLGEYHKADQEFRFHNGPICYIRTATDPFSVEGIQNVRAIWLDEAGKCSYMFFINLEGRAARTGAPIMLTTTPYGINWPYQNLIKPLRAGERDDVAYYEWLSIDNPSFPIEEYERQKKILDVRTFRRKYMGIHERMEGLVYELTNDNRVQHGQLPKGTRFFGAVDWGFAQGHEFSILIRAITQEGHRYEVDEFKDSGLDPNQQIQACTMKQKLWNVERFYCDPARPDMVQLLNRSGSKAIGFHEGREALKPILPGITEHTRLINSGRYKIWADKCPALMDEYETYHWPEFQDERVPKEVPVAINDHLMDCARYLTVGTMGIQTKETPGPFMSARRPHQDFWDPTKKSKKASGSWDA